MPGAIIGLFLPVLAVAQTQDQEVVLKEVVVVAPYDALRARERVAANVQSATAEEIERSQSLDLTDFLNRSFGSVSINHAQGNPLQPDVEPREVIEDFEDPRFFGAGSPFGVWVGFRVQL